MLPKRKNLTDPEIGTDILIIETAERLIAQKGIDGLKLKEVAEIVGVKLPSLYSHFANRSQIIERVSERAVQSLSGHFFDDPREEPLKQLLRCARRFAIDLMGSPAYVRLLLVDLSSPGGCPEFNLAAGKPGEFATSGALHDTLSRLETILERGQEAGQFCYIPAHSFYNILLGTILINVADAYRSHGPGIKANLNSDLDSLLHQVETLTTKLVRAD